MNTLYLILLVIIGGVWAQTEPSVSDVMGFLPPEYQDKVNKTELEGLTNKSTTAFKEKCEKNGGPGVFAKVEEMLKTLPDCVKQSLNLSDPDALQKEIDDAKHHGAVDEVFKKYCDKTPEAKQCLKNALDVARPCFTEKEKANLKIIYNVTEQLAEFVCYKEGDRIALFVAEDGPECYKENVEGIQNCVNQTFAGDFNFNVNDINANFIPEIKFEEKECKQLQQLQMCVVRALEKCATPTSANIIEALFKFVRKATPCKDTPMETKAPSSTSRIAVTSLTLAAALTAAVLL